MNGNSVAVLMMGWQDKIPQDSAFMLQESLGKVPEDKVATLSAIQLKNPFIGLMLGLFFGILGVDRFYIGDTGLGIAKLILTLSCVGIIVTAVWYLVDLILVWKRIKRVNLDEIQKAIDIF